MLIALGNFREENFYLPNGMSIVIDYGVMDYDFKDPFISGFERFAGSCRRSKLFDGEKLITEVIEENPDYISSEKEAFLAENHILKGDEFEKVINFPEGKVAKIEYWVTPEKRDENFGMYSANYRRLVLFDEYGEIISEVMERNPNYRLSDSKGVEDSQDADDEFLD